MIVAEAKGVSVEAIKANANADLELQVGLVP